MTEKSPADNFPAGYEPAQVWTWDKGNGGAFGCAGTGAANPICPGGNTGGAPNWIEENGVPAGVVDATPSAGTLASVFCIPSVGPPLGFLVNGAANLPGPGATSLPGTLAIP